MDLRISVIIVVALCVSIQAGDDIQGVDRRHLWNFKNMLGWWRTIKFLRYGCYCGLGGSGKPVDNLDRCCEVHDKCYGQLEADGCQNLYILWYSWSRDRKTGDIVCDRRQDRCSLELCYCDKVATECIDKHINEYNYKYILYSTRGHC